MLRKRIAEVLHAEGKVNIHMAGAYSTQVDEKGSIIVKRTIEAAVKLLLSSSEPPWTSSEP